MITFILDLGMNLIIILRKIFIQGHMAEHYDMPCNIIWRLAFFRDAVKSVM